MSSIVIGVRVRPFNQRELKFNSTNIVAMPTNKPGTVTLKVVRQGKILPDQPREFNFDHAFWTHDGQGGVLPDGSKPTNEWADQEKVFTDLGLPVLRNVLDGYNATLFAYGQTGSGKTYTMMGYPPGDVGLTPRICDELFSSLATMGAEAEEFQLNVECSYLEIYNEEVHDLLAKERSDHGLKVRQHPKTGVFVEGLRKVAVKEANDVLSVLSDGNNVRTVAATNMNASSSRSHAVVTLTVSLTMTKNGVVQGKYAKLVLVDLAGSERASSTGATGSTLVEGANINKSLSTLGMVLGRLADQADTGKSLPVPFRDSSLTFLLHDSFGGNSKTAMIANISPADVNYDETLSTLRFAAVTKRVKNKAIVNENPAAKLIRELTEELAGLKEKLQSLNTRKLTAAMPAGDGEEPPEDADGAADDDEAAQLAQLIEDGLAAQGSLAAVADTAEDIGGAGQQEHDVVTKEEFADGAAAGGGDVVFVDWRKPHLINLCPESRMLIMTVTAGDAYVSVEDSTNPASNVKVSANKASRAGAALRLNYSPLLNVVTIERLGGSADVGGVFVNGAEIAVDTPTTLEHADRLAVGSLIFRVSHTTNIPTAVPYSKLFTCIEHIALAEEYHRQYVMKQWSSQLTSLVRDVAVSDGPVEIDGSPTRHTAAAASADEHQPMGAVISPAALEDCSANEVGILADMRQAENDLVSQFPVSNAELAAYASEYQEKVAQQKRQQADGPASPIAPAADFDPMLAPTFNKDPTAEQLQQWASEGKEEYLAAKQEQEEALQAKQAMIATLKQELEALTRERKEKGDVDLSATVTKLEATAEEAGEDADAAQQESDEVEKALAAELKWHQEVKLQRQYRVNGPIDDKDAATWRFYAEGAKGSFPYLSQLHTEQEAYYEAMAASGAILPSGAHTTSANGSTRTSRVNSVHAASGASFMSDGSGSPNRAGQRQLFVQRFGRRGTFYKMKQNKEKWDLRYFIIIGSFLYYFDGPNGTVKCSGALYLKGCTIAYLGPHGGQNYVVLLKLAAPRRAEEPKDNSFYFAFEKHRDAALWCHWMAVASAPTMPITMTARLTTEALQQFESEAGLSLEAHPQYFPVDPLLLGLTDIVPTLDGDTNTGTWKNDETVTGCESCGTKFTFFNRRHHCRVCGGIFCTMCAPKYGKDNERTCLACQLKDKMAAAENGEGLGDEDEALSLGAPH